MQSRLWHWGHFCNAIIWWLQSMTKGWKDVCSLSHKDQNQGSSNICNDNQTNRIDIHCRQEDPLLLPFRQNCLPWYKWTNDMWLAHDWRSLQCCKWQGALCQMLSFHLISRFLFMHTQSCTAGCYIKYSLLSVAPWLPTYILSGIWNRLKCRLH